MLNENKNSPIRIIGIGNPFRSDDGVGHYVIDVITEKVCERLKDPANSAVADLPGYASSAHFSENAVLEKYGDNLIDLVSSVKNEDILVMIDAASSNGASGRKSPGKITYFDLYSPETREYLQKGEFQFSSHSLNPVQVIDIARNLGASPRELHLYVIEGKTFDYGNRISPEVMNSADSLSNSIAKYILSGNFQFC